MYKVVLVDDEQVVTDGLKKRVDWNKLQLEIAGVASNGIEALKLIENTKPDILITDVIMPVMDGLKLAETVKEMGKEIKIIILSGHDEFSYAQKAIKLGAVEYQLKPISVGELEEVLGKIIKTIEIEKHEKQIKSKLQVENIQNSEMLKRHFFSSIIEGKPENYETIIYKINAMYPQFIESKIVVSILEIDKYQQVVKNLSSEESELAIFSVLNITNEIVESNNHGFAVRLDEKRLAIVTFYGEAWDADRIYKSITWLFCRVKENLEKYLHLSVTIGVGPIADEIQGIRDSYLKASEAVKYKIFYEPGKTIKYEDLKRSDSEVIKQKIDMDKELYVYVSNCEKQKLFDLIDKVYESIIANKNYSYDEAINICYKLILAAKVMPEKIASDDEETGSEITLLENLKNFESIEEIVNWIKEFYSNLFEVLSNKNQRRYSSIVSYIIETVERNYAQDIELNSLSKKLFVTANYMSTIFKKETGISFKSYLTNYRLEKAKKLLLNPRYKIYQVANLVGYENEEYFCRIFKSRYGITCTEFKEKAI